MIFKIYSMLNELAERDLFMYVKPKRSLELIEVVRKGKRYNHHENFFPTSHQWQHGLAGILALKN